MIYVNVIARVALFLLMVFLILSPFIAVYYLLFVKKTDDIATLRQKLSKAIDKEDWKKANKIKQKIKNYIP